ncbi:E3 ubiquitin-protein ligase MARCHF1-like isoform X2 [Gigantopelta aegis]|uniref:E3 ubiquitin-protein ligase MARCHF1-like isoform X2 n=1 Tax=Gigantopelta aegis TaxID=1735272 RepID=UPI001B88D3AA|nr:E3 ubiquitin-protein ligase MARCHF1-like isoform X2 [Gigantopelta aegis]
MEEEASCPALMASNSEGSRKSRLTGNSGSSTSIKCRICQLTESETGEPVKTSDCRCKRDLASVHRSCLTDWVNYKGNNTCEVCKAPFANVPAPILTENIDGEQTVMHELFLEYSRLNPMTLEKRAKMAAALILVLILVAFMMVSVFNGDHEVQMGTNSDNTQQKKYSLPVLFIGVLAAMALSMVALWIYLELKYIIQRRNIRRRAMLLTPQTVEVDDNNPVGRASNVI